MAVFKRWNGANWEIIGPTISDSRINTVEELIAPEYDPNSPYSVGDFVVHSDTLYKCNTAIDSGGELWNSTHWTETKIGDEVSELKSAFDFAENTNSMISIKSLVSESGGVSYSNGKNYNNANYLRSDYIPVYKGFVVRYTDCRSSSGLAAIAFYDASKNYKQDSSVIGDSVRNTFSHSITENGYIRITIYIEDGSRSDSNIFVYNETASLLKYQEINQQQFTKANEITVDVDSINQNPLMYINNEGVAKTASSGTSTASNKIWCKTGDKLKFKLSAQSGHCVLAVYDLNDSVKDLIIGTGVSSYIDYTVTPYTFKVDGYFRIAGRSDKVSNYVVQYNSFPDKINNIIDEKVTTSIDTAIETKFNTNANLLETEKRVGTYIYSDDWKTYLSDVTERIKAPINAYGNKGMTFAFVTDCHIPRNNMLTPSILQHMAREIDTYCVVNGGDFLDNQSTASAALDMLRDWRNKMYGLREFCVIGNHDRNNNPEQDAALRITGEQFYGMMIRPVEKYINTDGNRYYIVDNDSQKIRLIMCDIATTDASPTVTYAISKLTELDSTWTALIVEHYIWNPNNYTSVSSYCQHLVTAIDAAWSNITCNFIGILGGHVHDDHNDVEANHGYHLIARRNNYGGATSYTTSSLAFDYVSINTNTKKITFTRVGAGDTTADLELSY